MKNRIQKWSVFIGKSMLWSLLLYVAMMLAINWDDIKNTVSGKNKTAIVTNIAPESQNPSVTSPSVVPANISRHTNIFKKVMTLLSGVAQTSVSY